MGILLIGAKINQYGFYQNMQIKKIPTVFQLRSKQIKDMEYWFISAVIISSGTDQKGTVYWCKYRVALNPGLGGVGSYMHFHYSPWSYTCSVKRSRQYFHICRCRWLWKFHFHLLSYKTNWYLKTLWNVYLDRPMGTPKIAVGQLRTWSHDSLYSQTIKICLMPVSWVYSVEKTPILKITYSVITLRLGILKI